MPENLTSLSASELIAEIARLLEVVRVQQQQIQAQQEMIERLEGQVKQQDERIKQLEDELRAQKKLKGKPKLKASQLNDAPAPEETDAEAGKRSRSGYVNQFVSSVGSLHGEPAFKLNSETI